MMFINIWQNVKVTVFSYSGQHCNALMKLGSLLYGDYCHKMRAVLRC